MSDRWVTARELADRWGYTPETILKWERERGLPSKRMTSRAIRFDLDEADAWATRHRANDAAEEFSPTSGAARPEADLRSSFAASPTSLPERRAARNEEN